MHVSNATRFRKRGETVDFCKYFFGGKLRTRWHVWAQARGCVRPYARGQHRRGSPSPWVEKFEMQRRKTAYPLTCEKFSPFRSSKFCKVEKRGPPKRPPWRDVLLPPVFYHGEAKTQWTMRNWRC